MKNFLIVWFGQTVSSIGSRMTIFAVGVWIFEQTGQATALALVGVSGLIPTLVLTLFSGIIVDRVNRKRLIVVGDTVAGCSTIVLLTLLLLGEIQIWHIYVVSAISLPFNTLQQLAYQSSVSLMIPKEQYTRASSLTMVTWYGGNILSPAFAAVVYASFGLAGVFTVDILTFVVAITTVLFSRIPQPDSSVAKEAEVRTAATVWSDLIYGFRYIWEQQTLRALIVVSCLWTLFHDATPQTAMILARTNNDEAALAAVSAASGVGGVIAAIIVSIWGGSRRQMLTYGWGMIAAGLGKTLMGLGRGVTMWVPTQAYTSATFPPFVSARRAFFMAKIDPAAQGRFFASLTVLTQLVSLFTLLLQGPLGDFVFEPAMAEDGALVGVFGWLVGTGSGAGYALQFVLLGLGMIGVGVLTLLWKLVRDAETVLADHNQAPRSAPAT